MASVGGCGRVGPQWLLGGLKVNFVHTKQCAMRTVAIELYLNKKISLKEVIPYVDWVTVSASLAMPLLEKRRRKHNIQFSHI